MNDEEMLTCPFDPIHKIIRHRMPYHIVKCQKNYHGEQLIQCHFNAMHWVPVKSMAIHLQDCKEYRIATMDEQRKRVDRQTRSILESRTGNSSSKISKTTIKKDFEYSGSEKY